MHRCYGLILFVVLLCSVRLMAAEEKDRWGVGVQPIIGYDDDASWTFGAHSAFYFNPDPDNASQELDELDLTTTISLNGGANVHGEVTKNFKGNDRALNVVLGCEKYIDYFYGDGEHATNADKQTFTSIDVPFGVSYSFSVLDHFYVSAMYDFLYHDIRDIESGDILVDDELVASDETQSSGLGIGLLYKTTNPGIYKRSGYQISLTSTYYSPALLSSSQFEYTGLSYRYYIPFFSTCVLGFHIKGETTRGDVPINYLPSLGGNKLVRGFGGSRYKARNCIAGQTEFRFPFGGGLAQLFLPAQAKRRIRSKTLGRISRQRPGLDSG